MTPCKLKILGLDGFRTRHPPVHHPHPPETKSSQTSTQVQVQLNAQKAELDNVQGCACSGA